jgi:selenium-binding protein 1
MTVIDVTPNSEAYGQVVGWTDVPGVGDELHHFGWNACSSALKHEGHDLDGIARRYLLVPGLRSSNIHVLDTQPDPRNPRLMKTIRRRPQRIDLGAQHPMALEVRPSHDPEATWGFVGVVISTEDLLGSRSHRVGD